MDAYSSAALLALIATLRPAPSAILDRYFPTSTTSEKEEVAIDVFSGQRSVTPFVLPDVEADVSEASGYETRFFRTGYAKDIIPFSPGRAIKRMAGEQINGTLSPAERMRALVSQDQLDMINRLRRRKEVMAMEALTKGKQTFTGKRYPLAVVNFQRDASCAPAALAGALRWGQAGIKPLALLEEWAEIPSDLSGFSCYDVILGKNAWAVFKEDADVKERLEYIREEGVQSLNRGAQLEEGLILRGIIDNFNIFTYAGKYKDPADNTVKNIYNADEVTITSTGIAGVQAHGAIENVEGLTEAEYFPSQWVEKNPSRLMSMIESAPLLVPTQVNAAYNRKVIN